MLYKVQSSLPHSGGKNFRGFRTIHEHFSPKFCGWGHTRRRVPQCARTVLCVCWCVAHVRGPHLHNNWTGAIRESFLCEIIVFVPKHESFLPRKFSAIRYVCASNCLYIIIICKSTILPYTVCYIHGRIR